jgi:multidrug efflux pump subunit AcrB
MKNITKVTSINPVSWMAKNHVAANLLMVIMLISGLFALKNIRQEIQPNYTYATVLIDMSYPGASPEEIEANIVLAIEARLDSIEGLAKVSSTASQGNASIRADIADGEDLGRILQNVKNSIDGISSFPSDAERPVVRLDDDARWLTTIAINGDIEEKTLHQLVNRIKGELLTIDGIIQVLPRIQKQPEVNIEIPYQTLKSLDLTIAEVAKKIGLAAKDVPSGDINTLAGDYILRTEGRRENALDYQNIALKQDVDGSVITLGDIATINDGFKEDHSYFSYNGNKGMIIYVYQSKKSQTLALAEQVKSYISELNTQLPENISLEFPYKRTDKFKDRMEMLIDNGVTGLLLVILVLGIFLNPRLAFWVGVSIPVVFISSFSLLSYLDVSINMISMFAFIMTLGIVVDDAIIVGESIHAKQKQGIPITQAVVEGVNDMILPVMVAVITNIIAFIPLLMMSGDMGQYMRSLPIVAIVVFVISLIEALLILPAHLNVKENQDHNSKLSRFFKRSGLLRERIADSFDNFRDGRFQKILSLSITHRYSTVLIFSGFLFVIIAWFESSRIDFRWYPQVPSDKVSARLTLPIDSSPLETIRLSKHIEQAGVKALNELGSIDDISSRDISAGIYSSSYSKITFNLVSEHLRDFNQNDFVQLWREKVGEIPQAKSLQFDYLIGFGGNAGIYLDMRHASINALESAAKELAGILNSFEGVFDVTDGLTQGKKQLKYTLTEEAKSLGITEQILGQQLKSAFFGSEALRFLKDSELVKVWVRLPFNERNSLDSLQEIIIRSPTGIEIPLSQAANVENSRAFTAINRTNGRRYIRIGGVMDPTTGNQSLVKKTLNSDVLPLLRAKYPGLEVGMRGSLDSDDEQSTIDVVITGFGIVCLIIFALVAALFKSYSQGIIVILTIPYCVAAAVSGHIFMGYTLTSNSLFGMVALSGLVINGAIVLTSKLNALTAQGSEFNNALIQASLYRFKAIVLTSITTTAGLLPMLFETSEQALFLVPFAIALSFGTVVSTLVVLILIPAFHAINRDLQLLLSNNNRDIPLKT